jgi:S1-C subfamily serine protease
MREDSQVIKAVKKVLPAVVSITCSKYLEFFESSSGIFGPGVLAFPKRKKVKIGGGSGFIVEKDGIILTNRHVVEDLQAEYVVVLQNGEKYTPKILARDPINDVAILKIDVPATPNQEKNDLAVVELGDSSKLELGQTVIAIGNALGLFKNTVSCGVISGLSREIQAQSDLTGEKARLRGLIQTDAAINPGNSGGPLVDIEGKAVGINAAMVFGAENIGFALPINNAKKDLTELKKYGRIRQPFLGIRYILLDKDLKEKFNLPVDFGALIISEPDIQRGVKQAVIPGSPAARAGLKEADIILEIENKKVTVDQSINDLLQEFKIGQPLILKILRGGRQKTVKIILGEKK